MKTTTWTVLGLALALGGGSVSAEPLEVEAENLRPGLVAHYRSVADKEATLSRLDAKPTFSLGHSSPHPRIPAGSFEVNWSGVIQLNSRTPLTFDAFVCGQVSVEIDGVVVLDGRGENETAQVTSRAKLEREPGNYRIKIRYRSLARLPARLQLWWESPSFSREPLPAWHLKHLTNELPAAVSQQQLAEKGRTTVERFGCARCHSGAFPDVTAPPPGPSLADVGRRVNRAWLLTWLEDPAKVRPDAHMSTLFSADRKGFVERWLVTEHLLGTADKPSTKAPTGDHRMGRRLFVSSGCATCHFLPDVERSEQGDLGRTALLGLKDRFPADELAAFLGNPHTRYPDGRMPRLPLSPEVARDVAAYLLEYSKAATTTDAKPPTAEEIQEVGRRLDARGTKEIASRLVREKRCAECHVGLGQSSAADLPLKATDDKRGCLSGASLPRFNVDSSAKKAIAAYREVAAQDKHSSPFTSRQRTIDHLGCVRCHQRDTDQPPAIEAVGSTLGGAWLQNVPYQRTPRLSYPHQKYLSSHLLSAVREGVSGLRPSRYTYRMPAFGRDAETVIQALAEADGDLVDVAEPAPAKPSDPTLAPLAGPSLAGFQGYGCVSCHVWNGQTLSDPDPGAAGTDLTRLSGRIRREWFDRFLEAPARFHPNTPMPAIFEKGKPALLKSVLDGDAAKQTEALWTYFALGSKAPTPKPPPPMPIESPLKDEPPLVAQIPLRLADGALESLCVLFPSHDLLVYDIGSATLHSGYTGAQIRRDVQGRLRTFTLHGTPIGPGFQAGAMQLLGGDKPESPALTLHGYDRLNDGVRIRFQAQFASVKMEFVETFRLDAKRTLLRELHIKGVPAKRSLELRFRLPEKLAVGVAAERGDAEKSRKNDLVQVIVTPDKQGEVELTVRMELPPAANPPAIEKPILVDSGKPETPSERPGYRVVAYPRPRTASGEDRVMPGAIAAHPTDGRIFVASLKTGEIFVVNDPSGDGKGARFDNYTRGLFQECFSMLAEKDGLYVLHRRNLTKVMDTDKDGVADRFERVLALPHAVIDSYDYAYGLVRDKSGAFVYTYAPHANTHLTGSGSALRVTPGKKPEEVGFGFRNPLGWCSGPEGEIFFTDNQGEWVATNKLCHLAEGQFYGFPNPGQREHAKKPMAKTTVWVPYAWAKSINGVTYDNSDGKFGPFAGQIFMAELMFGGAIIRANVEKVNGQYQGACFPFWGQGLLGPVTMAFDPKGRLWVGGITEPGWMAQPDRGAVFRLDYTGQVPFEMKSIHVLPRGFRIVFTKPVSATTAKELASYRIDFHRYEYTGAYGSPELDRTRLAIERVEVAADGCSVDLHVKELVKDRVYMIQGRGVRSAKEESLVQPTGAYTLHEIPTGKGERK